MTTNRAQHFVPRGYLCEFIDPSRSREGKERLWVYERGKPPWVSLVAEIAHQRDFYSFVSHEERHDDVDKYLQTLEADGVPALRGLAKSGVSPDSNMRGVMAEFIGMLSARVPAARNLTGDIAAEPTTNKLLEAAKDSELFRATYEKIGPRLKNPMPSEEVRAKLMAGFHFREVSKVNSLRRMLKMGWLNAAQLLGMQWTVLHSNKDDLFVTSDNPVVSALPNGNGSASLGVAFNNPSAQILFPLNPRACLLAARRPAKERADIPGMWVRRLNKMIVAMAERSIFASESSIKLQLLVEKVGSTGTYAEDFYRIPEA